MPNVGSIDVDAEIHGDKWPAQLKKIMERVGRQMDKDAKEHAKGYADTFSTELGRGLNKNGSKVLSNFAEAARKQLGDDGRLGGSTYGERLRGAIREQVEKALDDLERLHAPDGFAQLIKETGDVESAFERMRQSMRIAAEDQALTAQEAKRLTRELERQRAEAEELLDAEAKRTKAHAEESAALKTLGDRLVENQLLRRLDFEVSKKAQDAAKEAAEAAVKGAEEEVKAHESTKPAIDKHRGWLKKLADSWKGMSHNTKQWSLIIGAIAAAAGPIAVLGSAAGGALAIIATVASGLGAGIGVAIAGFTGLYDETIKLTPQAQAAKDAFKELGDTLNDLQGRITNSMFDNMATSIEGLTNKLIPGITGSIEALAGEVGSSIGRVFDALSTEGGIANFNALLGSAKTTVQDITTALIGFGDGFADIMVVAIPDAEKFTGWIAQIAEDFSKWTSSDEGRDRIREWLDTAAEILPKVGDLIVAAGTAIADLVTPEAIENTGDLLESLTNFMPALSDILDVLGNLDIFGLLAQAFETVGTALAPVLPDLGEMASIIGTTLMTALQDLAGPLGEFFAGLSPIIILIGELVGPLIPPLVGLLGTLLTAFGGLLTPLGQNTEAMGFLRDAVSFLGQALGAQFTAMGVVVGAFATGVNAAIGGLILFLQGDFVGAGQFIVDQWSVFLESLGIDMDQLAADALMIWTGIQNVVKTTTAAIETIISTVMSTIKRVWDTTWTAIQTAATRIWTAIRTSITTIIRLVQTIIQDTLGKIKQIWSAAWEIVRDTVARVWETIRGAVERAINAVKAVVESVMRLFRAVWSGDWEAVRKAAADVWEKIKAAVKTAIDSVRTIVESVLGGIQTVWSTLWSAIRGTLDTVWTGIKNSVKGAIGIVRDTIATVLGTISTTWNRIWSNLRNAAADIWGRIQSAIKGPIDAINGFVGSLIGPIQSAIGWMDSLFGAASRASGAAQGAANSGTGGRVPEMASGGLLTHARHVIAGEDGPEAIVPLRRDLSRVDPSVRWLSAVAQGKMPHMASGGVAGGDKNTVIESGAIQVIGSLDPRRTAYNVFDVIAERAAS